MHKLIDMSEEARDAIDAYITQEFDGVDLATLDPVTRYQAITPVQGLHQAVADRLAEMRKECLAELEKSGMSRAKIAETVGDITRQRVGQILGKREGYRKGY